MVLELLKLLSLLGYLYENLTFGLHPFYKRDLRQIRTHNQDLHREYEKHFDKQHQQSPDTKLRLFSSGPVPNLHIDLKTEKVPSLLLYVCSRSLIYIVSELLFCKIRNL